ncbi:GNAT family N-acetyltransferase [Roseibium algae]|uniref:GNAT family N-acetyltransferase n=1 Tax=Roseibium algae TaxID=3123038 RepID=A0ABU8TMP7_9HYPH
MQPSLNIWRLFSWVFKPKAPNTTAELFAKGEIRPISVSEKHLFRDHLLRLDANTRRSRFAMQASDAFLRSYVETSFTLDTLIYAYLENGIVRGTAELRSLGDAQTAEAAFCVEPDWRRKGIGTRLMDTLLQTARERHTRHIYINCLAGNSLMQALARKFSASMTFQAGDVIGHLHPVGSTLPGKLRNFLSRLIPTPNSTMPR